MHNVDVDMSKLECVVLQHGKHRSADLGMCFMEAIAWAYGGEFTDFPPCVPHEIARLGAAQQARSELYAYAAAANAAYAAYAAKQARRSALLQLLKDFCEVKP